MRGFLCFFSVLVVSVIWVPLTGNSTEIVTLFYYFLEFSAIV